MKFLKPYFTLIFFMVFTFLGYSQSRKAVLKAANRAFEDRNYYGAAFLYKQAFLRDSTRVNFAYRYAKSCKEIRNYDDAIHWFSVAYNTDSLKFKQLNFEWAETYKSTGNYHLATKKYQKYLKIDTTDSYFAAKARHELKIMPLLDSSEVDNSLNISKLERTINSDYSELGFGFLNDTSLIFTSIRPLENDSSRYVNYAYVATKRKNTWSEPEKIRSQNFSKRASNFSYCPDNQLVYFTVCSNKFTLHCQIYSAKLFENELLDIKKLPQTINRKGSNATQAFVADTELGRLLFFASDRKGGYGNYDLWYSQMIDNQYIEPINLGEKINTLGNEITPYFDTKTQQLYFSSDWHNSLGGFDVFCSDLSNNVWQLPVNQGNGLNTSYDETYFRLDLKHENAYFSSNREGTFAVEHTHCCNDIFSYPIAETSDAETPLVPTVTTLIDSLEIDIETLTEQLEGMQVKLFFDNDQPAAQDSAVLYSDLLANYRISFQQNLPLTAAAQKLVVNSENEFAKLCKSVDYIKKILAEHRKIRISLRGFSSPLATASYNLNLSSRRIESIVAYLKKEIPSSQYLLFRAQPLGESQAPKTVSDRLSDKQKSVFDHDAAYERRVELNFEVLENE